MTDRCRIALASGLLATTLALSACGGGPVAVGNTEPVDLGQLNESSDRFTVLSTLGEPAGSVTHEHRRCDIYKLYTSGLGAGGKAAVKAAEVLTSVATLGLAQIIWAPVRAGTRPKQHTVLMCYAANEGLVEIFDKNPNDDSPPEVRIVNEKLYSTPVAVAATKAVTQAEQPPISLAPATGQAGSPVSTAPATPLPSEGAGPADAPAQGDTTGPETLAAGAAAAPQAATPMAAPAAGTISLDNVSREAVDGPNQVHPGRVIVPDHASADDLNTLSAMRSQRANAAATAAQQGGRSPPPDGAGATP